MSVSSFLHPRLPAPRRCKSSPRRPCEQLAHMCSEYIFPRVSAFRASILLADSSKMLRSVSELERPMTETVGSIEDRFAAEKNVRESAKHQSQMDSWRVLVGVCSCGFDRFVKPLQGFRISFACPSTHECIHIFIWREWRKLRLHLGARQLLCRLAFIW